MGIYGVWGYCDECLCDTWVVPLERDYLDEPISWICGGYCCDECEDYECHCAEGDPDA